jgi:2-dehydropantoate 2-reductase
LEAPAQVAAVLGPQHALAGTCVISSTVTAPGCIRHLGLEPSITFGALDNRPDPRAECLREAFLRAEVTAIIL